MADAVTVGTSGSDKAFAVHPKATVVATCCDVIDLGLSVGSWAGQPKVRDKVALVWRSSRINPDTKKPFELWKEYTKSFFENANLRKDLEAWRGEPFTEAEAAKFNLATLVGKPALIAVAQAQAKASGRTYAKVNSIGPVPDEMTGTPPSIEGYQRADFWTKRKAEYAEQFRAHEQARLAESVAQEARKSETLSDFPSALAESDSDEELPFD